MDGKAQEFFKKISSRDERNSILKDLANSRAEVICKPPNDEIFKVIPDRFNNDQKLFCQMSSEEIFQPEIPCSVICQFSLGGEKYFIQAILDQRQTSYVLDLTGELYNLQRRQSYRIRIPGSTRSVAEVIHKKTNT